jgi:hypothetical protein
VLVGEEELTSAIFSAQDVLGSITEMTVIVDDRKVPSSLAYLVEIDGELCRLLLFFPRMTGIHCFLSFWKTDGNSPLG